MEPHGLGQGLLSKGKRGFCGWVNTPHEVVIAMGIAPTEGQRPQPLYLNPSSTHSSCSSAPQEVLETQGNH